MLTPKPAWPLEMLPSDEILKRMMKENTETMKAEEESEVIKEKASKGERTKKKKENDRKLSRDFIARYHSLQQSKKKRER